MCYGFGRVNAHKALMVLTPNPALTISSSQGGSVTSPEEGTFSALYGEALQDTKTKFKRINFLQLLVHLYKQLIRRRARVHVKTFIHASQIPTG